MGVAGRVGALGEEGDILDEAGVFAAGVLELEVAELGEELLVTAGLGGLALEGADLAADLADDVVEADQVRLGLLQLPHRLLLLALEAGDPGGFLEDGAAVLGTGGEDLVDLALLHDGVGGPADAGVHEELVDVAEAAEALVDLVFARSVAEEAAGDGDLVVFGPEFLLAVAEGEGDLGHAEGLPLLGAVEDDVGHLAAAEGLGRLLAEDPADRVEDVALAAPVRPDDGGDPGVELNHRFIRERFKPHHVQCLEIHNEGEPT